MTDTTDENQRLRRMLCVCYAGSLAYMDDGEAQDNRAHPLIDFLRDTVDDIESAMQQRSLSELAALRAAPAAEPVAWMREDEPPGMALRERASVEAANLYCISDRVKRLWLAANPKQVERYTVPLYAAINGPAACANEPQRSEVVATAGSGASYQEMLTRALFKSAKVVSDAAHIEGLADAIAWSLEHVPIMDSPGAPDWAGRHVHTLITAARAYQEAAAELARVKSEREIEKKRADDNWQECDNLRRALIGPTLAKRSDEAR